MTLKASLCACAILILCVNPLSADGTDDLNVIYEWTGYGNYLADGRVLSAGTASLFSSAMPAGSSVVQAFVYLHHLNQSTPDPATRAATFDAAPITMNWVGVSSGWGYQLYRADVTSLITVPATHAFAMSPSQGDDHAAWLVVIYSDPVETCRSTVIIADGENRWRWSAGAGQRMAAMVDMDWDNSNPVGSTPAVYATFVGSAGGVSSPGNSDRWGFFPDMDLIPADFLWRSPVDQINNSQGNGLDLDTYTVSSGFTPGVSIAYAWAYQLDDMHTSWTAVILRNVNCDVTTPTHTPTQTSTHTPTFTVSSTPTVTFSPSFTRTMTETYTPGATPTASPTTTPSVTFTPTSTESSTSAATLTQTITNSPTDTQTSTHTPTFTVSSTPTVTFSPSFTRTMTETYTPGATPTASPTTTPSVTFTPSASVTRTFSPSPSFSTTPPSLTSSTPTATPSTTPPGTLSPSFTLSGTASRTASVTASPSVTALFSQTATFTRTPAIPFSQPSLILVRGLFPNPFSDRVKVWYTLRTDAQLEFRVYNVAGESVFRTLTTGKAGGNLWAWEGSNDSGGRCASGSYLLRCNAKGVDGSRDGFWEIVVIQR